MIQIEKLRVRSLDVDFHEVSWQLAPTSEDVLDYTFRVFRSESPEGPFDPISVAFRDRYTFIDNSVRVGDRWRRYFYEVEVAHVPSGKVERTPAAWKDPDPDLIATAIRQDMMLLFREFAGRRCWVLPARTFGQRCSCWNVQLQQRRRSGCRTCFDTSFVRGYLSPIETWIQIDPSAKSTQAATAGSTQQSNTTARLPYYPPVKPNDLLVEGENRRWRVVSVSQTEHLRAALHQEVQLHEVPPKDIEFVVPLNMEEALRDLSLSPSRNFTNPHNLENLMGEEVPNLFDLYPSTYPRNE